MTPSRDRPGATRGAALWRLEEFRRFWAAHTVSQFGTQIGFLALPLVAIAELGAGPFEVAVLGALEFLPYLLFGLPAGVWVDRLRRRMVMVVADVLRFLALTTVPVAWATGWLSLPQLYAVGLIVGLVSVFFDVASQSYLPSIVSARHLTDGNAKLETSNAAAKIGGPSIAGVLIQAIGAPLALTANAVSYLGSAAFLMSIGAPDTEPPRVPGRDRFWSLLLEGIHFVRSDRRLRTLAASAAIGNLGAGIFDGLYLLYLIDTLDLSPTTVGIVFALGNVGLLAATLLVRRLSERINQRTLLVGAAAARVGGYALAPIAVMGATLPLIAIGRALVAGSVMTYNVEQVTMRQQITPAPLLGRVNAAMRFVSWGTIPLGMLVGGLIASAISLVPTLWIGTATIGLAVVPLLRQPANVWPTAS